MVKKRKKYTVLLLMMLVIVFFVYSLFWLINYNNFSDQSDGYKYVSHNAWYRELNGYIYTLTKPDFPSMKACYVITDKADTLSLFFWKNSFLDKYESGMEVYDEKTNISYCFMIDKNFMPETGSMNKFSRKEKEVIKTIIEDKNDIIEYERKLAREEWGL